MEGHNSPRFHGNDEMMDGFDFQEMKIGYEPGRENKKTCLT
jgi:hypothetical protein